MALRSLSPARFTRAVWLLAALLVLAFLFEGWRLLQLQALNERIRKGPHAVDSEWAELRFAAAYERAASSAATGSTSGVTPDAQFDAQFDAALNQFRALQGPTALGQAARYNSANLLLRQALVVRSGAQPGQAIALVELAKESLREVLRQDPANWEARYNLERAQRLLPDPPELEDEAATAPRERERAATTMRAQTLGLP